MTTHHDHIPDSISEKLGQLLRRFKRVLLLKGLAVTIAVFLGAMLVSVGIDRLIPLYSMWPRIIITAIAFLITFITAFLYWVIPSLRKPDSVTLAATAEADHPDLHEIVSSTV